MSGFRIGRTEAEHLGVRVLGRTFPGRDDWEANWLNAEVEVRAGGFRGRFGVNLLAGELAALRDDLARLYAFASREAAFEASDGRLSVKVGGDGLGNFTAECEALDEGGSRLRFSITFALTEIPAILSGLDAVLQEYPSIGEAASHKGAPAVRYIRVNIEALGWTFSDSEVPDGYTPEDVISALQEDIDLPRTDHDGRAITYSLLHLNSNVILPPGVALAGAGVRDGDTLQAVRSGRIRFGQRSPKGDVEVFLIVLDLNRVERVSLPRGATAAEVIRRVAADYDLPARDMTGEVIVYRLESKATARFILNSETLYQAGVPYLDRLTLHREEVAGGGDLIIPFMRPPRRLARFVGRLASRYRRVRSGRRTTPVECTVYARPSVPQGTMCFIQVFAYDPLDARVVYEMAREFDNEATRRGFKSLETEVAYGSTLTFHLTIPGIAVDDPIQSITWYGSARVAPFGVNIPGSQPLGDLVATVRIAADQVPLGHIKFKLTVVRAEQEASGAAPVGTGHAYKKAFISYARQDVHEVLKRVQVLDHLRINFFQDVLSLKAGERWEAELRRHIRESDLFLLFWSSRASQSQAVLEEIRYALELKRGDEGAPPEIMPIPIEGPPPAPPPPGLEHLHFDDYFLYLQSQTEPVTRRFNPPR